MRVLAMVLVTLLAGCLVHDDVSKKKGGRSIEFSWDNESRRVKQEASSILDLCSPHIGAWQEYGVIDDYLIPHVNWEGEEMTEEIEAHRYVDKTSTEEGEPACELQIWVDSLAVKYMDKHRVRCTRPDHGAVFFRLDFGDTGLLRLTRDQNGDCDEKLLFIAGNIDGSLTMVTGHEFSWDGYPSPFGGGSIIAGRKGQVFSANERGELSSKIRDTVVAPVPQRR